MKPCNCRPGNSDRTLSSRIGMQYTDEDVFTQPWTVAWYAFARAPQDYVPVEYACFEGNAKNILLMTDTDITGVRVDVP